MDVHTFIKEVRNNEENEDFINKIKSSINKSEVYMSSDLSLKLPVVPETIAKTRTAKFIHGNMFEEFVLKAAKGDTSKVFEIKDESVKTVWSRIEERKQQYKEIHNEAMTKDYEDAITRAGVHAWKILSSSARSDYSLNQVSQIKFEEVVQNYISSKLVENLRADFVARTETNVFLVDLKFSSMEASAYEEHYLVNGILQVLIYSLVMGVDPSDLSVGVLVYYGRKGIVALYNTDVKNDEECMKMLKEMADVECTGMDRGEDFHTVEDDPMVELKSILLKERINRFSVETKRTEINGVI